MSFGFGLFKIRAVTSFGAHERDRASLADTPAMIRVAASSSGFHMVSDRLPVCSLTVGPLPASIRAVAGVVPWRREHASAHHAGQLGQVALRLPPPPCKLITARRAAPPPEVGHASDHPSPTALAASRAPDAGGALPILLPQAPAADRHRFGSTPTASGEAIHGARHREQQGVGRESRVAGRAGIGEPRAVKLDALDAALGPNDRHPLRIAPILPAEIILIRNGFQPASRRHQGRLAVVSVLAPRLSDQFGIAQGARCGTLLELELGLGSSNTRTTPFQSRSARSLFVLGLLCASP